jgi:hypothetical protein
MNSADKIIPRACTTGQSLRACASGFETQFWRNHAANIIKPLEQRAACRTGDGGSCFGIDKYRASSPKLDFGKARLRGLVAASAWPTAETRRHSSPTEAWKVQASFLLLLV